MEGKRAVLARYLLLLMPPPPTVNYDTIRDIYEKPITAVLEELTRNSAVQVTHCTLDIAAPLPQSFNTGSASRNAQYLMVQRFLAALYKLVCIIAVKHEFNVEDANGIDVRILLVVSTSPTVLSPSAFASSTSAGSLIVPIRVLANSGRSWQSVFAVDCDAGDQILGEFLSNQEKHLIIQKVASGTVKTLKDDPDQLSKEHGDHVEQDHRSVAVGGTFDHLHIGHKLLLTMSAYLLPNVTESVQDQHILTVGITGDELLGSKKYADVLQDWSVRQTAVGSFLQAILDFRPPSEAQATVTTQSEPGPNGHVVSIRLTSRFVIRCVEISDPFGPTITDPDISALVVSAETRAGGRAVNDKRLEKAWPALDVFEVAVLDTTDSGVDTLPLDDKFADKLSSTRIRQTLSERGKA